MHRSKIEKRTHLLLRQQQIDPQEVVGRVLGGDFDLRLCFYVWIYGGAVVSIPRYASTRYACTYTVYITTQK